jgi:hypothetical protein
MINISADRDVGTSNCSNVWKDISMYIYSKSNPPPGFYIYAYLRKSNNTIYYIGKGKNTRAWDKHHFRIPRDLTKIVILNCGLLEMGAFILERKSIQWYGRKDKGNGDLRNKTDGGEGATGAIRSKEAAENAAVKNRGRKRIHSAESNILRSKTLTGRKIGQPPAERIERIRMALIGRPNPRKGIPQKTIVCPYCNKVGGYSGMKRYHFDNCSKKVQEYLEKSVLLQ